MYVIIEIFDQYNAREVSRHETKKEVWRAFDDLRTTGLTYKVIDMGTGMEAKAPRVRVRKCSACGVPIGPGTLGGKAYGRLCGPCASRERFEQRGCIVCGARHIPGSPWCVKHAPQTKASWENPKVRYAGESEQLEWRPGAIGGTTHGESGHLEKIKVLGMVGHFDENAIWEWEWLTGPEKGKKDRGYGHSLWVWRGNPGGRRGNPKPDTQMLVKTYARKIWSAKLGAPVREQQKLHDDFERVWNRMQEKAPRYDLTSEVFWRQLERAADKWWARRAIRGPGVDW